MKHYVLLKGGVETLEFFSKQLAAGLENMGHKVYLFDLCDDGSHIAGLVKFLEEGPSVLITFNFEGIAGEDIFLDKNSIQIWDAFEVRCVNIVVDHPFYYYKELKTIPQYYTHINIDRDHRRYMERMYPEVNSKAFLPLAGTQYGMVRKPICDRTVDVVFTGNYSSPSVFEPYITRLGEEYEAFYRNIIEDLKKNPMQTMEETFEAHMKSEIGTVSQEELKEGMHSLIFIDLFIRFYFRGEVIKMLADQGIRIHIIGKGWETLSLKHPENLILCGQADSEECLKKIGEARISLNIMPWFKDGAHDRVFNSMLNGTVCVSDTSSYLKEELKEGEEICFYELNQLEKLPDKIRKLLKNEKQLQSMADHAYEKARKRHTWTERAKRLVKS